MPAASSYAGIQSNQLAPMMHHREKRAGAKTVSGLGSRPLFVRGLLAGEN